MSCLSLLLQTGILPSRVTTSATPTPTPTLKSLDNDVSPLESGPASGIALASGLGSGSGLESGLGSGSGLGSDLMLFNLHHTMIEDVLHRSQWPPHPAVVPCLNHWLALIHKGKQSSHINLSIIFTSQSIRIVTQKPFLLPPSTVFDQCLALLPYPPSTAFD